MNYLFSIITRLLRNYSSKFISLVFSSFSQKVFCHYSESKKKLAS